jgi:uncharacterized protein (TIGR02145 family)
MKDASIFNEKLLTMQKIIILSIIVGSLATLWTGCEKDPTTNNNSTSGSAYLILKISGNNQSDTINKQLNIPLKVQIQDSLGVGVEGESVTFTVTNGGGSLNSAVVTTNSSGFAEMTWTLGSTIGVQSVSGSANVSNGSPVSFTATGLASSTSILCPPTFGSITDSRDGEVYSTVTICSQTWMAQNLRYNVSGSWVNSSNPSTTYGRLYDWGTVMNGASTSSSNPSGVQGICPSGWHLPSDSEWNELELSLGMTASDTATVAYRGTHGTGMRSTTGWGNGNGTNVSGFNAFPAGSYNPTVTGVFNSLGSGAHFWSSTERLSISTVAWDRHLAGGDPKMLRHYYYKTDGLSCRCIKD